MVARQAKKFFKSTSGNVAIMFAIGAVPLLIAVGASVDMVRANRAQAILQAAADAAVLGAAAENDIASKKGGGAVKRSVEDAVDEYLAANDVNKAVDALTGVDTVLDRSKGKLTVTVTGRMNTSLMSLAGIDHMDLNAISQAELGMRAMQVALVLDNTGSMGGQKIIDLMASATNLVSILFEQKAVYSRLEVGVVPYSEYVNVGLSPPGGGWQDNKVVPAGSVNEGCVGSRPSPEDQSVDSVTSSKYPSVGGVRCGVPLLPLTGDKAAIDAKIASMQAEGNTYIPAGLLWGWNILTPEAPYTEGMSKKDMALLNGSKALVLMTDGENTISANAPFHDGPDGSAPDILTLDLCGKVKADGITLFTVGFQTSPAAMAILEQCASGPEYAFDAANGAALNAAFTEIGAKLAALYLSK